jgi:hypothetical protein
VSESAIGALSNAASTEHESTRQRGTRRQEDVPPQAKMILPLRKAPVGFARVESERLARVEADNTGNFANVRAYTLAKRNMWGPPVHYQRPLKLNPPERANHDRSASRIPGLPGHAAGDSE